MPPTSRAREAFSYDGDQRPSGLTTSWLPGSGNSGTILSHRRTYDNASNVISIGTTLAAVSGVSGSGGSEVQNFCYNEQKQLVWAGNGGTQPGAGNGTCGSGTLSSGLVGAGSTNPTTYTNLGEIWKGPLNGGATTYQYLYCNSAKPYRLSVVMITGSTCSNQTGALYHLAHDAWGTTTTRTYNGTTATLS